MDHGKFGDYKRKNEKSHNNVGSDKVLEAFVQRQLEWQTFYRNHESFMNTLRWIHARVKTPIMEEPETEQGLVSSWSSWDSTFRKNRSFSSPDIKNSTKTCYPEPTDLPLLRNKKCRRLRSAETAKESIESPSLPINGSPSEVKNNRENESKSKTLMDNSISRCTTRASKDRKITIPDGHALASQDTALKKRTLENLSSYAKGCSNKQARKQTVSKDRQRKGSQNECSVIQSVQELKLPPLDVRNDQMQSLTCKRYRKPKSCVKFPPIDSDKIYPAWK